MVVYCAVLNAFDRTRIAYIAKSHYRKFQANRDGLRHVPRNAVECVLFRSLLHHIGGVIVGPGIAYLGTSVEALLGVPAFAAPLVKAAAWLL